MLVTTMAVSLCLLVSLSVLRYLGYNAGMLDLGNMTQAIWSVTQRQPLLFTFQEGQISRLAFHVELIYFLFVPFYMLWPDPRLLLIGQAGLFVLGAWPVYRLALRRLESRFAARCAACIYLFYPVAQTAVLFDFHGDTLALPLLMFALEALERRAWRSYWVFIALALSCKFYVAAPVALIGVYLWFWGGERRAGALTFAVGIGYGLRAFLIIRRLFAPTLGETVAAPTTIGGSLAHYFGEFDQLWATLGSRLVNALIVFGPALFLARYGWRWLLPALPIALVALFSTGPGGVSDYRYHHYATVVPFVVMAVIEGANRMRTPPATGSTTQTPKRNWRADLGFTTLIVVLCSVLLVDTPLNPRFWLGVPGMGLDPAVYGVTERDRLKDQFLARHITPTDQLVASTFLAPHVVNRSTLYLMRYADDPGAERIGRILPQVDTVLTDALFDWFMPIDATTYGGGVDYEREAIGVVLRDPNFGLVAAQDGLLVFRRDAPESERLTQQVEVLPSGTITSSNPQRFGESLELLQHTVEPLGNGRLRATFAWRALQPLDRPMLAVSTLDGVAGARMVHLPTYAMLPVTAWQPGQIIRETFEVQLPPDVAPGSYTWRTGWYEARSPYAALTDERSLTAGSSVVELGAVEVR